MAQVAPWVAEVVAAVPLRALTVAVVILLTLGAIRRRTDADVGDHLRMQLFLGVPWGTLLTIAGVLAVYLFVQGAWWHGRPLVTPFRTWSYAYPLGMLTGAFAHSGQGHLIGNLVGTLVFGAVAEYAWRHFPEETGLQMFISARTNPMVRLFALPVVAIPVGIVTALFAVGPVVGFSGVVFALAGFAVVSRPWLFLGALVTGRILDLVLATLRVPELTAGGRQQFVTPWWANIAIQGHAVGFLLGALLGLLLLRSRDETPRVTRVFFATLVFAVFQGLWAVYLPLGGGRFRLFRWLGVVLVFGLALVLAVARSETETPLSESFERPTVSLATIALVVVLVALAMAAIPTNVVTIGPDEVPDGGLEVRDYVVTYEEDIENAYVANVWDPLATNQTSVTESGVIVASADREAWIVAVQRGRLALNGRARILVGGVGWRETVVANRTSWQVLGNDTVYTVSLRREGAAPRQVFVAPPSTADARVAGRQVTIAAEERFEIRVRRDNRTLATGPIPANGTTAGIGGLTFERNRSRLYAAANDTRVKIAVRRENQRQQR